MQYVVTVVPLLVLALIVGLVLASALRMVSRDQMDEDLKDLIRRR